MNYLNKRTNKRREAGGAAKKAEPRHQRGKDQRGKDQRKDRRPGPGAHPGAAPARRDERMVFTAAGSGFERIGHQRVPESPDRPYHRSARNHHFAEIEIPELPDIIRAPGSAPTTARPQETDARPGAGRREMALPPQLNTDRKAASIPAGGAARLKQPTEMARTSVITADTGWQQYLPHPHPTPVQERAIPPLIAGKDLITTARTGSGKTLAFLIPAAARGMGSAHQAGLAPEVLVVAPTRELAVQIRDVALELGLSAGRITGGISAGQTRTEATGKGVISGTPGRLKDLINKKELRLGRLRYLVLDEADELLSLGFLKDLSWIIAAARRERSDVQIALASATFPAEIREVAQQFLREPEQVDIEVPTGVTLGASTARHELRRTLPAHLLEDAASEIRQVLQEPGGCVVLFSRTKHLTKRRAQALQSLLGHETVSALQGNMDQKKREHTMGLLRSGQSRVLVATDIAGRGIDLPEVRLVIHLDVAATAEDHVHRSGRTARAGRPGRNLVLLVPEQLGLWTQIQRQLPSSLLPGAGLDDAKASRTSAPKGHTITSATSRSGDRRRQ